MHPVRAGDTLLNISRRYDVDGGVERLREINGLGDSNTIHNGGGVLVPENPPRTDKLEPYRPTVQWRAGLSPCEAERWPKPTERKGRAARHCAGGRTCTEGGDGRQVCMCAHDVRRDDGGHSFTYFEDGERKARFYGYTFMGDPKGFEVADVDLDADGVRETVVAALVNVSNGLGVDTWQLTIIDGGGEQLTRFVTEHYGEGTFATPGDGRCELLVTTWEYLHDQLRGEGCYLTARRFEYREGGLVPVIGEVAARRLLYSFAYNTEDLEDGSWRTLTLEDLTHPNTQIWPWDPLLDGLRRTRERGGTIEKLDVFDDAQFGPAFDLAIRLENGRLLGLKHVPLWEHDESGGYHALFDAATGIAYPHGYVPVDPRAALLGREVSVVTYADEWGELKTFVWLLSR